MTQTTPTDPIRDASASPITFERVAAFPPPGWQVPRQARLSPDGRLVTYLQSEAGGDEMALFALDLKTGESGVLVRAADVTATDKPMSREEELRRERQRQRIRGVTGYAWAKDAPVMLLPLGGDVYLRSTDGKVEPLTHSDEPEIDPQISADGSQVAFVRGRELYVVDVATGKERQLTKGAPEGVTRGQSDFNGQEEFGEAHGFWWSPDGKRIAYLEVDERDVAEVPVMGYRRGADLQHHRYPRAGTTNPKTKIGVLTLATGKTTWLELPKSEGFDPDDQYVGRFAFGPKSDVLYFQRLSRDQHRLALVRCELATGATRHVVEQSHDAWLELAAMRPLEDGTMIWSSYVNEHRHLEHRDGESGKVLHAITKGD
ncbi:MAG: DPP IV N-terminal domain-containing protein, partial [Polyangiaceae bacterium]